MLVSIESRVVPATSETMACSFLIMLLSRDDFPTLGIPTIDIEKDSFVSTALEESDSSNKISRTSPTPEPLRAEIPIGSPNTDPDCPLDPGHHWVQ